MTWNFVNLSKSECTIMKGYAIFSIIIHNFLHLSGTGFVKENESTFFQDRLDIFNTHVITLNPLLFGDIFSYLGFYGVPIFAFLSGYGLVRKYESTPHKNNNVTFTNFLWHILCKFWKLMLPAYLLFLLLNFVIGNGYVSLLSIVTQITFTNNLIFRAGLLNPGSYWYFGFSIQLYIFYYCLVYKKQRTNMLLWLLISTIIQIIVLFYIDKYPNQEPLLYIRHNFIGWLSCFLLGIWWAKNSVKSELGKKDTLFFLISIVMFVISIQNKYLWLCSPILIIYIFVFICKKSERFNTLKNIILWFGKYSAYLFVMHPIVRLFCIYIIRRTDSLPLKYMEVIVYVIACCAAAYIYSKVTEYIFNRQKYIEKK